MVINDGFVEDIVFLGGLKDKGTITKEQLVELFDLIDGLDEQEIDEMYSTILYQTAYSSDMSECMKEAQKIGFDAVELLIEKENMGELLQKGVERLMSEGVID